MLKKSVQRSIDIPAQLQDAIDRCKVPGEGTAKFVILACYNEVIRRCKATAGPADFMKPLSLPDLPGLKPEVRPAPTRAVSIDMGDPFAGVGTSRNKPTRVPQPGDDDYTHEPDGD
jgi:hypothetical protein